jgi:hypothetical protein
VTLPKGALAKIEKLIPMLSSNHDGEVVGTVKALLRVLEANGASIHDLSKALSTGGGKSKEKIVYKDRIVYRDRVVEKIVEKVVYRDRDQKHQPKVEAPDPDPDDWKRITFLANKLMECDLNDREEQFVIHMGNDAGQFKSKFKMSEKQKAWFERLIDQYDVDE